MGWMGRNLALSHWIVSWRNAPCLLNRNISTTQNHTFVSFQPKQKIKQTNVRQKWQLSMSKSHSSGIISKKKGKLSKCTKASLSKNQAIPKLKAEVEQTCTWNKLYIPWSHTPWWILKAASLQLLSTFLVKPWFYRVLKFRDHNAKDKLIQVIYFLLTHYFICDAAVILLITCASVNKDNISFAVIKPLPASSDIVVFCQ